MPEAKHTDTTLAAAICHVAIDAVRRTKGKD